MKIPKKSHKPEVSIVGDEPEDRANMQIVKVDNQFYIIKSSESPTPGGQVYNHKTKMIHKVVSGDALIRALHSTDKSGNKVFNRNNYILVGGDHITEDTISRIRDIETYVNLGYNHAFRKDDYRTYTTTLYSPAYLTLKRCYHATPSSTKRGEWSPCIRTEGIELLEEHKILLCPKHMKLHIRKLKENEANELVD